MHRVRTALVFALLTCACEPELVVGTWTCPPPDPDQAIGNRDKVVDAPWATGFETGFCDYQRAGGFCYGDTDATFQIVNSPVHGGRHAAAFSVASDPSANGVQTRCVREGALPRRAAYGAWFYFPSLASNAGNWNLMHFQGGDDLHSLWDVSLGSAADGSLYVYLFDFLNGSLRIPVTPPPVPIGSWMHLEFRLQRASDATGQVALYQDGVPVIELANLVTDDTEFAQWYVGNYADGLTPPDSTIYVDDVTIRVPP